MYQARRISMALLGVILCGLCVGMLQKANLGVDPFTCFVTGIANIFSSTYSTFYLILTGPCSSSSSSSAGTTSGSPPSLTSF